MSYCADTNILLRWIEPGTPICRQAQDAVKALRLQGELVHITPQNLVEFWNGATRPIEANGLGLSPEQADIEAAKMETLFPLLPEKPAIHKERRRRIAASRRSCSTRLLLSFSTSDCGIFR
jgi:hypothetical protein